VIRELVEQSRLTNSTVEEAATRLRIRRSLLYRLVDRYRRRPQTSSLLPYKRGRDRKTRFLEATREDLLATCVKEVYLVPERPSMAALIREVRRRFAEHQLPVPNYRTVASCVDLSSVVFPTQDIVHIITQLILNAAPSSDQFVAASVMPEVWSYGQRC